MPTEGGFLHGNITNKQTNQNMREFRFGGPHSGEKTKFRFIGWGVFRFSGRAAENSDLGARAAENIYKFRFNGWREFISSGPRNGDKLKFRFSG